MTEYESTHGSVVHVEHASDDVAASRTFLETVFGWSFAAQEGQDSLTWQASTPPGGGLVDRAKVEQPTPPTLLYVQVDDLAGALEAIDAAGGDVLTEEMAVPGMGAFARYRDPGGVVAGAWEERFEGAVLEGGVPTPTDGAAPGSIVHFELYTEDPAATAAFHEAVFGWTFEPVEAGGYTMARPPTPPFGGLMPATDAWPAGAMVYLLVARAEDAVGTVTAAGGTVLREPFEVEGWGTMAVFEAPGGVVQAVWEPVPEGANRPAAGAPESEPGTD